MVTFARYADNISPPTLDHEALLGLLDQVGIVELPTEDGTAIGDAIVRAIDLLGEAEGASKAIILLTDGSYNAGEAEPLVAAQIAGAYGIRIHAIGAGTRGTALMPVPAADGGIDYRPSEVTIDEATLEQIAQLSEGRYFRATDAAALRSIYAEIDRLEKGRNVAEAAPALRRDLSAGGRPGPDPLGARDCHGQHPPARHPLKAGARDALCRLAGRLSARAGARAPGPLRLCFPPAAAGAGGVRRA